MQILSLDFESFSKLDLPKVGTSRYWRHKSTRPLLLGWAIDDDPVEVWRIAEGQKCPKKLKEALRDPDVVKCAWNAPFEMQAFEFGLDYPIPIEEWIDAMVLAMTLSFPGKLEKVGPIIGLPEDKVKSARGKALIRKFCKPRKPTKAKPHTVCDWTTDPEEWEEFVEYCRQDVEAERAIRKKLWKWNLPQHEWDLWHIDQHINRAGIPVNRRVVNNAIDVAAYVTTNRLDQMRNITGLKNPNSNQQLLPWLQEHGYKFDDLKKGHVQRALDNEIARREKTGSTVPSALERVLSLRQEASKTSVKKYNALQRAMDDDDLVRNTLQFAGAQRTWRWGGRIYQPQNLAKPVHYLKEADQQLLAVEHLEKLDAESLELIYPYPMDLLSTCVRPVVQAPEGYVIIGADLNAIENRVVGWLANDQKILDVFRNGRDPYVDFGVYMFNEPYEVLWREFKVLKNKTRRNLAKPPVLGGAYMLGKGEIKENKKTGEQEATGLLGYAWNMGVKMTPEQSELAVTTFRETFEKVVQFWYDLERAMKKTIRTGRETEVGFLRFDMSGPFLRMHLPSGRCLHYYKPRVESKMMSWGKKKDQITYEGLNDKKAWVRISTHPGKVVENATQAVARDVLAHGLVRAYRRGVDIRFHIHDEIRALARIEVADEKLEILQEEMRRVPKWAPGLLLGSEGDISPVFMKAD